MSDNKTIVWADLSPKKRNKILEDHRKWVYGEDGQRANLRGANLRGADLRGAYLEGANLRGAYLEGAVLQIEGDKKKITGVWQCGPGGSRNDYLVFLKTEEGEIYLSTGCQRNVLLKDFNKLVKETHGNNEHAQYYKAVIAVAKKVLK